MSVSSVHTTTIGRYRVWHAATAGEELHNG
jgi:hypothetical protein